MVRERSPRPFRYLAGDAGAPVERELRLAGPRGPFTTLTPEQVEQFDEEGFVVVPDLIDADTLAEVRDDLDRLEAEVDAFLQTREDGRFSITETGALTIAIHAVTRSEKAKALSAHPAILGLCADLIGPDVRLYWDQAVYKKTEKPRRVPWHQDNGYTYVEPQEYLTVWLALTDATEENGCPEVAPGCHRHGTLPTTTSTRSAGSASRRARRR